MAQNAPQEWVPVSRETFEAGLLPWVGRKYEGWLRAWARQHPVDRGQVLIPERVQRVYAAHILRNPVTRDELKAMGYPDRPA